VGAVTAILLGIAMVAWPSLALEYLVRITGVAFCVAGIFTLVLLSRDESRASKLVLTVVTGSLILGTFLWLLPGLFTGVLIYLLGLALVLAGAWQLLFLLSSLKVTRVPAILYLPPAVTLAAGVLVIADPFRTREMLVIFFGAAAILAGAGILANRFIPGEKHREKNVDATGKNTSVN
jgi:uncharacterized membrane protein HdeD (DUF308 family)